MKPHRIQKILNIFLFLFFFLTLLFAVLYIGNGGVLNDMDMVLAEMQDLERRNLLHNPPDTVSLITRREIKFLHNSEGVKNYIRETEELGNKVEYLFLVFMALCFLCLGARIYYRKKKDFPSI